MSNRKSATTSRKESEWAENEASPPESLTSYSNIESSNIDSDSESVTSATSSELSSYLSEDYKDVRRGEQFSGEPDFDAFKKSNNERCIIYFVPYTKTEFEHLKKVQAETANCSHLHRYSRVEKKGKWILIEYPWEKNMYDIFGEMNPDFGHISPNRRENFDEAALRAIIIEVLRGLQFIHNLGYIHGAVRAASVYVKNGVALLGNLHMIRRPNVLYFTTIYAHMSPEMIVNLPGLKLSQKYRAGLSGGFGFKTDIWSLGLFLTELSNLVDIDEYYNASDDVPDLELAKRILRGRRPYLHEVTIGGPVSQDAAWKIPRSTVLEDFYGKCTTFDQYARWSADRLLSCSLLVIRGPLKIAGPLCDKKSSRKSDSSKKRTPFIWTSN